MSTPIITEKEIRLHLMDKPELNPLLQGVRWSAEDIENTIANVISAFNEIPPFISRYTIETFPYRYTLLNGVTAQLLRSAAINEASNQFQFAVDGVTVQDKDKADIFTKMADQLWGEFMEFTRNIKVQMNIKACFGSVGSEYHYRVY